MVLVGFVRWTSRISRVQPVRELKRSDLMPSHFRCMTCQPCEIIHGFLILHRFHLLGCHSQHPLTHRKSIGHIDRSDAEVVWQALNFLTHWMSRKRVAYSCRLLLVTKLCERDELWNLVCEKVVALPLFLQVLRDIFEASGANFAFGWTAEQLLAGIICGNLSWIKNLTWMPIAENGCWAAYLHSLIYVVN